MRPIRILGPCILALPLSAPLAGQIHHIDKPKQVTRAVGVYEWTGDMLKPDAARLIPVSIFINGRFQDAGVFLAHPIPLAVETGNVYAVQHAGDIVGNVDLDFARNIIDKRSVADDNPIGAWYGYGRFIPLAAAPPPPKLTQHSATPAVVVGSDDDSRPHFVQSRNQPDDSPANSKTNKGSSSSSGSPAPADDPDRPHMNRRDSASTATDNAPLSEGTNGQGTAAQDPGSVPADDPDRPTLGHRNVPDSSKKQKKEKESGSGVEAMPTSLNEDPDRPDIHRGKVQSATAPPQLTGSPANLHQAVAVSDAANNPLHVFSRDWETVVERAQTMTEMEKLAQPLVRQYLAANHLEAAPVTASASTASAPKLKTPAAKPATKPAAPSSRAASPRAKVGSTSATRPGSATHTAAHTASAPATLTFTDEQISGYTLSYGGLPTFVYSAALVTTSGLPVRVTIIAQRLPAGSLQLSLSSVTDEDHLDRTPWMRLIDAVDPDDSHRASLLFELRAKNSRQFALYSLATAEAQQTFVTGVIE
jgi:hypothetical protein